MNEPGRIALIAVSRGGIELARGLRTRLRAGELFLPQAQGLQPLGLEHPWEQAFEGPLSEQVPAWFARFDQLVFFLAAGAVVRLIAPCLTSKETDPGVLAVDELGQFVIPLLSGHQGGANTFARRVAGCLGACAVITTASDVLGGLSPDLLAEEFGWAAEPRALLKPAAAALVNHQPVAVIQEIACRGTWLDEKFLPDHVTYVRSVQDLPAQSFAMVLWITDRLVEDLYGLEAEKILWYRPRTLVLGAGCERGISLSALEDGLEQFLKEQRLSPSSIATLATADLKSDEPAFLELAKKRGWQTAYFSRAELAGVQDLPNPSPVVQKCLGTPGVAEPAALLASGAGGLLAEKHILTSAQAPQRMTFALARLAQFEFAGRSPGKVVFIGAGPGDPDLLTLKARNLLARAEVVVYAGSLIPEAVIRQAPATARLHDSASLTLEEVMPILISAARAGRRVVRLQSGDTSIYSALQEQIVLLEEAGIAYEVVPGISSYQALAAALGRELTVPEVVQTVILTRAQGQTAMPPGEALQALAAHRATLAIFLSARLGEAVQANLLTAYPPETPVVIAHRVSWPDQQIVQTTLDHLQEEIRRHRFTRTTLILVGPGLGGQKSEVGGQGAGKRSRLYDPGHGHIFRSRRHEE